MALQIKKTLDNGIEMDKCYVKIIDVDYTSNPNILIRLAYYFNQEARDKNKPYIWTNTYQVNLIQIDSKIDTRENYYNWFKKQDEFKKAIDI